MLINDYSFMSEEEWNSLVIDKSETLKNEEGSKVIYFDMDGVLAKWCSNPEYPPETITDGVLTSKKSHYFRNLEPDENALLFAKTMQDKGYEIRVLTASYYNAIEDKLAWLVKHMPFIDVSKDVYIVPCNLDTINKQNFIPKNSKAILIDDNNKNLEKWNGIKVKYLNGINSRSGNNDLILNIYSIRKEFDKIAICRDISEEIDTILYEKNKSCKIQNGMFINDKHLSKAKENEGYEK